MSSIVGGLISAVTSIFGGGKETTPPPVEAPKPAPAPDDQQALRTKEREAQRKYAAAGRASTIMTDETKLG
mgnify:CR=1 FL=1